MKNGKICIPACTLNKNPINWGSFGTVIMNSP